MKKIDDAHDLILQFEVRYKHHAGVWRYHQQGVDVSRGKFAFVQLSDYPPTNSSGNESDRKYHEYLREQRQAISQTLRKIIDDIASQNDYVRKEAGSIFLNKFGYVKDQLELYNLFDNMFA